jgi:hypothetical protein
LVRPEQAGSISAQHLERKFHFVLDALTPGLGSRPKLEVLDPTVRAITVAMMNGLIPLQGPSELDRHH